MADTESTTAGAPRWSERRVIILSVLPPGAWLFHLGLFEQRSDTRCHYGKILSCEQKKVVEKVDIGVGGGAIISRY